VRGEHLAAHLDLHVGTFLRRQESPEISMQSPVLFAWCPLIPPSLPLLPLPLSSLTPCRASSLPAAHAIAAKSMLRPTKLYLDQSKL
jgi:hypothetical protein